MHSLYAPKETIVSLILSLLLVLGLYGIIGFNASLLEIGGVWLNFACVYLATRENNWQWPIGIIACVFLSILFWQSNLLASFALNLLYFIPVQFFGWYRWLFGGIDKRPLYVTKLQGDDWSNLAFGIFVSYVFVFAIDQYFGGTLSGWDSAIFTLSIVSQWLLNEKKRECWIGWLAVNIISVYVYGTTGLYLVATQYFLFMLNAGYGFYRWKP